MSNWFDELDSVDSLFVVIGLFLFALAGALGVCYGLLVLFEEAWK